MTTPLDAELPELLLHELVLKSGLRDCLDDTYLARGDWAPHAIAFARAAIAADRAARQPVPGLDFHPAALPTVGAPAVQAQQRSLDAVDAARWRFFDENAQSELRDRSGTRRRFAEWMQFSAVMEHGSRSAAIDHWMDRAAMTPAPQPPQGGSGREEA
jgi:hypothetical protein